MWMFKQNILPRRASLIYKSEEKKQYFSKQYTAQNVTDNNHYSDYTVENVTDINHYTVQNLFTFLLIKSNILRS